MTADEFIAWAMARPEGERYELVGGEAVAMAPERAAHTRVKYAVVSALKAGVAEKGLPCEVFIDGMAVEVSPHHVYEPDALVRCGPPLPDDAVKITDPLIVVEVLSPSSRARDAGAKLADYFQIPLIHHYLIVDATSRTVTHHERADDQIRTRILRSGALELDPPGFSVAIEAFFP
jgi:Uma2 family endonuclease